MIKRLNTWINRNILFRNNSQLLEMEQLLEQLKQELASQKEMQELLRAQLTSLESMRDNIERIRYYLEQNTGRRGKSKTLELLLNKLEQHHD